MNAQVFKFVPAAERDAPEAAPVQETVGEVIVIEEILLRRRIQREAGMRADMGELISLIIDSRFRQKEALGLGLYTHLSDRRVTGGRSELQQPSIYHDRNDPVAGRRIAMNVFKYADPARGLGLRLYDIDKACGIRLDLPQDERLNRGEIRLDLDYYNLPQDSIRPSAEQMQTIADYLIEPDDTHAAVVDLFDQVFAGKTT